MVLNVDIIDGARINRRKAQDFPEDHARIIDALNRKIAEGTKVVYIPGNHDEELRRMDLFGKTVQGLTFAEDMTFTDPKGRSVFICHGDRFDKDLHHPVLSRLEGVADVIDVGLTSASAKIDKVVYPRLKHHFQIVARVRSAVETVTGTKKKFENTVIEHARETGHDVIVTGHDHFPDKREEMKDGKSVLYLNSGDWVENFSAITMDANGEWGLLRWLDRRKELGLGQSANKAPDDGHDKDYRPATDTLVGYIHAIWPGKNGKGPEHRPK